MQYTMIKFSEYSIESWGGGGGGAVFHASEKKLICSINIEPINCHLIHSFLSVLTNTETIHIFG